VAPEPTYPSCSNSKLSCSHSRRYSSLRKKYQFLSDLGYDLLASLLRYDPEERISADVASRHPYFEQVSRANTRLGSVRHTDWKLSSSRSESPYPKHPDLFSSFPSVAAGEK
jgi:cell division cycle 2-like protein